MDGWNTTFLLGRPIVRGHVSFREGIISFELAKLIFKREVDVDSTGGFNKCVSSIFQIQNRRLIQVIYVVWFNAKSKLPWNHVQHDPKKQPKKPLRRFFPVICQVMRWFWWVTSMPIRHHSRFRWPCEISRGCGGLPGKYCFFRPYRRHISTLDVGPMYTIPWDVNHGSGGPPIFRDKNSVVEVS